jgi:hypothetical protein
VGWIPAQTTLPIEEVVTMALVYKICPRCGSSNSLVWKSVKYPDWLASPENHDKGTTPDFRCRDCGFSWSKKQLIHDAYGKIRSLKVTIGGHTSGYQHVLIDFTQNRLLWSCRQHQEETTRSSIISDIQVVQVRESLIAVNLLNWKNEYQNTGLASSTHWNLQIETDETMIEKHGHDAYPAEWSRFENMISAIIERPFGLHDPNNPKSGLGISDSQLEHD